VAGATEMVGKMTEAGAMATVGVASQSCRLGFGLRSRDNRCRMSK